MNLLMILKSWYNLLFFFISTKKLLNKQKKIINISFSITNEYTQILLVPLISLFENSDKNTIYYVYILVGENFEQKNEQLLYNLETIYFNCFIKIINLGKEFENVYSSYLGISIYYRLKLPEICTNNARIIYLDSDTIVLRDLMEMYTLNFNGNYILGKLDVFPNELDKFQIYITNYINSGVLLMDLFNLRKYRYVDKFMNYVTENNNAFYLKSHDQTVINYLCHNKIGILKPAYHMWPYGDYEEFLIDHKNVRIKYNVEDVKKGFKNPFIIHFPGLFKYREKKKYYSYFRNYYQYLQMSRKYVINYFNQTHND